jgi:broad specificity phosphatase PhoE
MLSRFFIAAFVVFAAPAYAARAVILVRHAEKQAGDDPELTMAGEDRANDLTRFLRHNKVDAIFTSELKRTKATAAVLVRQRALVPVVVKADDVKGLVARIRALPDDAVALVVGHSNTLPLILAELGVADKVTIEDNEFGRIFVVTPTKSGRSSLLEFAY